MRALIIEDEPVAARQLARMVAAVAPDLELAEPLPDVETSVRRLRASPRPDLLFMDVQLADGLCFDILQGAALDVPVVVTTAFDSFALQAFEFSVIDYLLKPIDPARLRRAISRWRSVHVSARSPSAPQRRFLVPMDDELVSIPVDHIAYFHRDLAVRLVTTAGDAFPVNRTLDQMEGLLDTDQFFRLNRQVLASVHAISRVYRRFKGKLGVELKPEPAGEVIVSAERAAHFRRWLGEP
jgi:DNA-binding LytR/AlgR family response regulator